jgi:hypothetical protein
MKIPLTLVLVTILVPLAFPASAADRACRPSLSNFYHCPDASSSAAPTTKVAKPSGRACVPSISNLWTCPDNSKSKGRSVSSAGRACRPSLSNGYSCPKASEPSAQGDTGTPDNGARVPKKTVSTENGGCRPSLSNGYKCPDSGASNDASQYTTEAKARAHCAGDMVVWASEGMRAARNETHP